MHFRRLVFFCMLLLLFEGIPAQEFDPDSFSIAIRRSSAAITIDGTIEESDWMAADVAKNFFQQFPFDSSFAKTITEVRMTYDEHHIYIAATCFDPDPGNYVIQSLKRDFSYPASDAFAVYMDPFHDKVNGFCFSLSPLGVQREGTLEGGGQFGVTTAWDNRWFAEVKQYDDRWEAEMAIPFKTIRYNAGQPVWRINFSRHNLKENENSSWVPVPRNFNVAMLAYTGRLVWDQPPAKAGSNVSLIPYIAGGTFSDYENNEGHLTGNGGGDAKIAVSSSLNLDLCINPDFSQVEVDQQVTNLDRFELFFPERRQFFIENSDLFSDFGFRRIRPFFSRRIGLNNGLPVRILGGGRISGKLNRNWRIGAMNLQTEGGNPLGADPQNYTVMAVQRQIFSRSNLAAIVVNRQAFEGMKPVNSDYNRLIGLDYNLYSADNKWRGKFFYHHSFDDNTKSAKSANAIWLMYNDQKMTLMYNHEFVDRNYNAEVGFVPRQGYFRFEPIFNYRFYPANGKSVNNHGPELYLSQYWENRNWKFVENQARIRYQVSFQNRMFLAASAEDLYIWLQNEFDPTRTGGVPLPDSTGYRNQNLNLEFASDFRKRLTCLVAATGGNYYDGKIWSASGELAWRLQPYAILSLKFAHSQISLPAPYETAGLSLFSPKFEFSFSRSLFFTTFFQYNTQAGNFNINARFQWRFKPMSDLYIVLTENYDTGNLSVKNRALVFKLNYWFTI